MCRRRRRDLPFDCRFIPPPSPPPKVSPTRLDNRDVYDAPILSPIRPSDVQEGPWCPTIKCHNTLPHRVLFVTGCAGEMGTSQLLSWPPSSFAIASLAVIASIAMRQSIMRSWSFARPPSSLTTLPHDAPATAAPLLPPKKMPYGGAWPPSLAATTVCVAFVARRRDEAGSTSRPPSSSRRRTASACLCCAARWSGGIESYGSLKEGEGDKEFDGVTKNPMGVMRRVYKRAT
jgi:hypothetical protein